LHAPLPSDRGRLDEDEWELYHVDLDPAESENIAEEHPEKLQALIKAACARD
jgi:arylsulfatase A-like enzyme